MDYLTWKTAFTDTLTHMVQRVTGFVPNLLGAAILLLLGWLVARLSRGTVEKLLDLGLRRLAKQTPIDNAVHRTGLRDTVPWLAGAVVYWIILLFFAAAAVEKLELTVASNLVSRLAFYLPNVLVAMFLIFVAIAVGSMARSAIAKAGAAAGMPQAPVLARAVEILIIFVGVVIGIDQAGIQSTLLTLVVAVCVATVLGGLALAFGLGSSAAVSNLISARYLANLYRVGQMVRIDGVEGRILELTQTGVVLEGVDGRVLVPARKFTEQASVLITGE